MLDSCFSSENFQDGMRAGGSLPLPIIHILSFYISKFSQIKAKIIIMNVGIDKTFLKFKFSQEIINNGEKCGLQKQTREANEKHEITK